ncbi:rRNA maturation RNase YbeY [Flavobacteriaceae bacterium]|nr:rRNA maturation RNase YbeY [Flavobacteriaceae bacterium]MDA8993178.1 rRNA maturation RNase YbeY [Flavobacteriaceae bacterium]
MDADHLKKQLLFFTDSKGFSIEKLSYNFISRDQMFQMNVEYLNHDTDTDILTFDYSVSESLIAEIFISLWAIRDSAKKYAQTIENELIRTVSHGLLHCLGYNDKSEAEKMMMRKLEDEFIELFHVKPLTDV